ncbi:PAQR family membrane homeostasis protein TrhA [Angustibacter aerolatus]
MSARQPSAEPGAGGALSDAAHQAVAAVKPKLRGWLHAGTAPLAVAAGIVLICLAPTTLSRLCAAIFTVTAGLLFGTSAVYHRGTWSPRAQVLLKRMDHSNIFLIIAGTYTPLAALLLPADRARNLLLVVWLGALAGVLFRVFWVGAPRLLYVACYIALGWAAVFYLPAFGRSGGTALLVLIMVGGALYTGGAVCYALKRPNPSPRWFGFHEVFHACTVAAFVAHYVAVSIAVYSHSA